jgi:sigma-B regulation protein RsbU (phosphoserine phosphatase)
VAGLSHREPVDDELVLDDRDQTLADADQTHSDGDQSRSDADQSSADSDQSSADSDQLAADRDQAASDRGLALGADPGAYEFSHDVRERTARQRDETARQRDGTAQDRLLAAQLRDEIADARDIAAQARDAAADARNVEMAQLDDCFQREDDARPHTGADVVIRAAAQRKRAAERRAHAARSRDLAAQDRQAAADDRVQSARERKDARAEREDLALELRSERERRERALRHQHRAEALARTLQRTLSPPKLPQVAGLDVAVHYEPFAPEEVGGDFYDLFHLAGGRSGFFLGDVCGKGPDAAMLTSLARYTMRTAAMLHERPDEILMDLNAALLMDAGQSLQTCTAIYGQIDMHQGTVVGTLAAGGHPPPLIVRVDGSVEETPARGTMLGAVEGPVFHTCDVELQPGDTIFAYSDGILDAEIDGVRVDEEQLAALLGGPPDASAQAIVDRLVALLHGLDHPLRDDVAAMALRRTPVA